MTVRDKVKACMIGESVFKVGDYTSLSQGWSLYKNKLSLEECTVLKIVDLYYTKEDDSLPKFRALVQTNKGNIIDVSLSDLEDVRSSKENHVELDKMGYDYNKGSIYCKAYEDLRGKWTFYDIGTLEEECCEAI